MLELVLANPVQSILGALLILFSLGVILLRNPVHASLSFLMTLLLLAMLYLQLSAQFISVMQVLVYAGAIMVIFMFVIVLFQDAYRQIDKFQSKSAPLLLYVAAGTFLGALALLGNQFFGLTPSAHVLPAGYGTVKSLGMSLYVDFFFPFEAVILLFLIAVVGALYVGRKRT